MTMIHEKRLKDKVVELTEMKLKSDVFNKKGLLLAGAVAGIILIVAGIMFSGGEKEESVQGNAKVWGEDTLAYTSELEEKLKTVVESIKGVSQAKVMIMLDSSYEYIYASNSTVRTNGQDSKESQRDYLVLKEKDGSEYPVLVKKMSPYIKGVAVVCDSKSAVAKMEIISLVSTLFDISSNKIYVYS